MNKEEIKNIVRDEIERYIKNDLDKDIKKIISTKTQSHDVIIDIIKDSLEAVYKTFWQKRDFWKNEIK